MVTEITEKTFEQQVLRSTERVVLMFVRNNGCPNCEAMKPIFEQFAAKHPDIRCLKFICASPKPGQQFVDPKEVSELEKEYRFPVFPGIYSFDKKSLSQKNLECVRGFFGKIPLERLEQIFISKKDLTDTLFGVMVEYSAADQKIKVLNDEIQHFHLPMNAKEKSPIVGHIEVPGIPETVIESPLTGGEEVPDPNIVPQIEKPETEKKKQ